MSSRSHEEIDQLSSSYGEDFKPDVEAALVQLHEQLGIRGKKEATVRPLPVRRWLGIAAGFLLILLAGWFVLSNPDTSIRNDTNAPLAATLPDGTAVVLQEGAELTYDEADFTATERRIDLRGQGYFEVAKDAARPFLVTTGSTTLRVTGTAFNLRVDGEELEVEVSEGSVALEYGDHALPISARQCGLAKPGAAPVMMEAPNLNRHAWRTGRLVFDGVSAHHVLQTLHNNWNTEASLPADCTFQVNSTYNAKSVADVPHILQSLGKLAGGHGKFEATGDNRYAWTGECR